MMISQNSIQSILQRKNTLEELEIPIAIVHDLIYKILFNEGNANVNYLSKIMRISQQLIDEVLAWMQGERLVDVTKAGTLGRMTYIYRLTEEGMSRARSALDRNQYVGPVPVSVSAYRKLVAVQADQYPRERIPRKDVRNMLTELVLPEDFDRQIGPAINNGQSLFLYGPPGNGKTTIAQLIGVLISGTHPIHIPFALTIGGQIIQVYDPLVHHEVKISSEESGPATQYDQRWGIFRPPVVVAGGELDMDSLDLRLDPAAKFYEAPLQIKANGGMLLIDDFGRQRMRPQELLNRWIVPLEARVDYFRLQTGQSFEIPFRQLIIFSTNINPLQLVDEAFLRRIQMKVLVQSPDEKMFYRIFTMVCNQLDIEFNRATFVHLLENWYRKVDRRMQAVHPRDLLHIAASISQYENQPVVLTPELIDAAAASYFVAEEGL
jgi:predicted ATPase with chaperone activity